LIGSFTTFSIYGLEGIQMIQSGKLLAGGGYIILSNVVGFLLVIIGKLMIDRLFIVAGG
jgi:fluoride ion exporter CrcB/FEX